MILNRIECEIHSTLSFYSVWFCTNINDETCHQRAYELCKFIETKASLHNMAKNQTVKCPKEIYVCGTHS